MAAFFGEKRPSRKKCCVPGCGDKDGSRFRFPKRDEYDLRQLWLKKINNSKLFGMPFEKLYKSYAVCERHFLPEQRQYGRRKGVKPGTIPVLNLPPGKIYEFCVILSGGDINIDLLSVDQKTKLHFNCIDQFWTGNIIAMASSEYLGYIPNK